MSIDEPYLTWDILLVELPKSFYDSGLNTTVVFRMLVNLSYVCKKFRAVYRRYVKVIPDSYARNIPPSIISDFVGLVSLDLFNTNLDIKELDPNILRPFTSLTYLSVGVHRMSDSCLATLTSLSFLNLSFNNTITDSSVSTLTSLQTLSLRFNAQITDRGISTLTSLTHLTLPEYDRNDIGDGLLPLTNLKVLHLGGSKVTDDQLSHLTNLEVLHLDYDKLITDDGISPLKKLLLLSLGFNTNINHNI